MLMQVHYFALNDIEARGYVRQYCVSYITSSPNKLIDHFQTLLHHFNEVCHTLPPSVSLPFLPLLSFSLSSSLLLPYWFTCGDNMVCYCTCAIIVLTSVNTLNEVTEYGSYPLSQLVYHHSFSLSLLTPSKCP